MPVMSATSLNLVGKDDFENDVFQIQDKTS